VTLFVWFESLPGAPMTYSHWTFAPATGTMVPGEIRLSGQLQNGKNLFGVGTDNQTANGTGDWTSSDKDPSNMPLAVPTKQWLCIEWNHKGDTNRALGGLAGVPGVGAQVRDVDRRDRDRSAAHRLRALTAAAPRRRHPCP
jgi:hypothetical protein